MHNAPVPGDEEPGPRPGGLTSGAETAPMPKAVGPEARGGVPAETSGGWDGWFGDTRSGSGATEDTSVLPAAAGGPGESFGGRSRGRHAAGRDALPPHDPLGDPGLTDPVGLPPIGAGSTPGGDARPGGFGPTAESRDPGVPPAGPGGAPGESAGLGGSDSPLGATAELREPAVSSAGPGGAPGESAGPGGPVVPGAAGASPSSTGRPGTAPASGGPGSPADGTGNPGGGQPAPAGPAEPRAGRGTTIALVVALVLVVVMSGVLGAVAVLMTRNPDAPPLKQTPVRTLLAPVHFAPVTGVGPAPCTGTEAIPDDKGTACYLLDPGVTVTTVQKIEEVTENDGTYSIRLVLSPADQEQIAALTRETVKQQLAIVVGEKVVAAPRVAQEITQDSLGIAGFDKAQADAIMALLTGSAPANQPNPAATDGTQPGGTQPDGTQPGGTQPDGTQPGGTQPDGTQLGGTQPDGTQPGGTVNNGGQPGGTQPGGTVYERQPDGTQQGGTQPGGGTQVGGGTQPGGTQPTLEGFQ
nr:hypothetical protein GCM10017588_18230 [Microbispora rosea subsp. aerata]